MPNLDKQDITKVVKFALAEDIGSGDYTSQWTVPAESQSEAYFLAKDNGIIAGLPVVSAVFQTVDPNCRVDFSVSDGDAVQKGQRFGYVKGQTRALLTGERTALNFLQRLSGIATTTRKYVDAVRGTKAVILDTRKTVPGLRLLDKYAVHAGGGQNHRTGLYDMVLIKDNHICAAGGIPAAVANVRAHNSLNLLIEVEVTNFDELRQALDLGVDRILLDNMSLEEMRTAVELVAGRIPLEASGTIRLPNVAAVAQTGVDYISIGALTHSVQALDISLEIE